jgi:hypothetical protein
MDAIRALLPRPEEGRRPLSDQWDSGKFMSYSWMAPTTTYTSVQCMMDLDTCSRWRVQVIRNGLNVSGVDDEGATATVHGMVRCTWGFIFMYSSDPLV